MKKSASEEAFRKFQDFAKRLLAVPKDVSILARASSARALYIVAVR